MPKDTVKSYNAGVKEYRETYWTPEYTPKDTDFLACFKIIRRKACRAKKPPPPLPPKARPAPGPPSGPIC